MLNFKKKEQIDQEFIIYKQQKELEKNLIDQQLIIYKNQNELNIDREIHERKLNNWKELDEARRLRMEGIAEAKSELAKLQAMNESIKKEVELLKAENNFLKDIIANYSKQKIVVQL